MKAWAMTLILAALVAGAAGQFLPKGEKSPLYGAIRLLSAMTLLVLLLEPVQKLLTDPSPGALTGLEADATVSYDPEAMLLKQSEKKLTEKIREAFPEGRYEILFETRDAVITKIRIVTEDAFLGEEIARWLAREGWTET